MSTLVTRVDGSAAPLTAEELDLLDGRIRGPVAAGYGASAAFAHPLWNPLHPDRPAVVVGCTGTADVVEAIRFARERDLRVTVRGGGHSVAGTSTATDGFVLDLGRMRAVQVDPDRRCVRVHGGALLGDVDRETQVHGLATPLGRVSGTGVAGLTLGGGYGNLSSAFGLACDNLVEVELVGADGTPRTVSAERDPEVFWALRGAGGGLGAVTWFTFRLHAVGPLVAFAAVLYPVDELPEVQRRWRDLVTTVPDSVSSCIVTMTFPAAPGLPEVVHDRPVAIVAAVHAGAAEAGMTELAPFRALGTPLFDMSGPTPYTDVQAAFDPFFPRRALRAYWRSLYVDDLTDAAVDAVARRALDRPAPLTLVNSYHLGGAVHAVGDDESAFPERSAPFMVSVDTMWTDPGLDAAALAWADETWDELAPYGNGGSYANFTGRGAAPTAPDAKAARVAVVRSARDPIGLFSS